MSIRAISGPAMYMRLGAAPLELRKPRKQQCTVNDFRQFINWSSSASGTDVSRANRGRLPHHAGNMRLHHVDSSATRPTPSCRTAITPVGCNTPATPSGRCHQRPQRVPHPKLACGIASVSSWNSRGRCTCIATCNDVSSQRMIKRVLRCDIHLRNPSHLQTIGLS